MRFMLLIRATPGTEAGEMPGEELLTAMGRFNEEMVNAGVLLSGEGLHPSSRGARVRFSGEEPTVVDGPFENPRELIAGYWMIQVGSREEAIEWARRCPDPSPDGDGEIEVRQVFSAEDFGPAMTPELRDAEDRMREQVAARAGTDGARTPTDAR